MATFFIGHLPDVLYHGSLKPVGKDDLCLPASSNSWWRAMDWDEYDEGVEGEHRTAYANIVWEFLGLRDPARKDVPDWAAEMKDMDELGDAVGMLFVTDDRKTAESRYGPVLEVDMTSPSILDVAQDPNPGLYNAWIILMKAGSPLPILTGAIPRP